MSDWDMPDGLLEPPEVPIPHRWCDCCRNWAECPDGCGWGWCLYMGEFACPDGSDDCSGFGGEPPEMDDDPRIDMLIEEGNDDDR